MVNIIASSITDLPIGAMVTVTGWGESTHRPSRRQNVLRKYSTKIITPAEFTQQMINIITTREFGRIFQNMSNRCLRNADIMIWFNYYNQTTRQINDRKILALSQNDRTTTGDSGVGVVFKEPGRRARTLVAVHVGAMYALPSNNPMTPTTSVRVSYYADWIQATTGVRPTR